MTQLYLSLIFKSRIKNIFKGRIENYIFYTSELTFEAAFDNCRKHFKLLSGIETMFCMGWYSNPFAEFKGICFVVDGQLGSSINDLYVVIKG